MTAGWTYEPNSYLNTVSMLCTHAALCIYAYKYNFGCIIYLCPLQKLLLRNFMFIVPLLLDEIYALAQREKFLCTSRSFPCNYNEWGQDLSSFKKTEK